MTPGRTEQDELYEQLAWSPQKKKFIEFMRALVKERDQQLKKKEEHDRKDSGI